MQKKILAQRLRALSWLALILGLTLAGWLWLNPGSSQGPAIGYEIVGGQAFAVGPGDSKSYNYDVERMGGKFAVLQEELSQWFLSQWHGQKLARSVALLCLVLVGTVRWVARELEFEHAQD